MVAPADQPRWLESLVGERAAEVLRSITVQCLHTAHEQAHWRWLLAPWTNNTTFGVDRYAAFCHYFGQEIERLLPGAIVHRPEDMFGSPFLVRYRGAVIYPWRHGETEDDPVNGALRRNDSWIFDSLGKRESGEQAMLDLPGLPPISLSNVIFVSWAGSREEGLTAAYLGRPFLGRDGRHVFYDNGDIEPLDVTAGRTLFELPKDMHGPTDHAAPLPNLTEPPLPSLNLRPEDLPEGEDEDAAPPTDETDEGGTPTRDVALEGDGSTTAP